MTRAALDALMEVGALASEREELSHDLRDSESSQDQIDAARAELGGHQPFLSHEEYLQVNRTMLDRYHHQTADAEVVGGIHSQVGVAQALCAFIRGDAPGFAGTADSPANANPAVVDPELLLDEIILEVRTRAAA
jgi:hypothetical protein